MLAPIFSWEFRRTMDRPWFHGLRLLYALTMVSLLVGCIADIDGLFRPADIRHLRLFPSTKPYEYGTYLMSVHFWTVYFVAPILAIGPLHREMKLRTLELLMTTQLSSRDVIGEFCLSAWGKTLILTSPGVPLLFALNAILDSPWWVGVTWIVCVWAAAMPFVAWSMVMALSVRQSFTALVLSYLGNGLLLLVFPAIFRDLHFAMWSEIANQAEFWFTLGALIMGPTFLFLFIAARILRRSAAVSAVMTTRTTARSIAQSIGDEPWHWKQTLLNDAQLPRWIRASPTWCRIALLVFVSCASEWLPGMTQWIAGVSIGVVALCFPLAALICASMVVVSEREANTWDSLRLSSIRADEFVEQTKRAIRSRIQIYWLALLPAVATLLIRYRDAGIGVLLLWGLAGVSIRHAATVGFLFSARSSSTWVSLLSATMIFSISSFFIASSSYATALIVCVVFLIISRDAYLIVAFACSLPLTYYIFFLISRRIERATIEHLIKSERLLKNPLGHHIDDWFFE